MYRDVFVGYFENGFDPAGEPDKENSPFRASPFFPGFSTHYFKLISRINDGTYVGMKVDWGAWAAIMTKQQIIDFIQEEYGNNPFTSDIDKHLRQDYDALLSFVGSLSPDEDPYLVASSI